MKDVWVPSLKKFVFFRIWMMMKIQRLTNWLLINFFKMESIIQTMVTIKNMWLMKQNEYSNKDKPFITRKSHNMNNKSDKLHTAINRPTTMIKTLGIDWSNLRRLFRVKKLFYSTVYKFYFNVSFLLSLL